MALARTVKRINLGSLGLEISAQCLGCMGMPACYGPPKPEPDMIVQIRHAVDNTSAKVPTLEEMAELESLASADAVKGDRYGCTSMTPHFMETFLKNMCILPCWLPCCSFRKSRKSCVFSVISSDESLWYLWALSADVLEFCNSLEKGNAWYY